MLKKSFVLKLLSFVFVLFLAFSAFVFFRNTRLSKDLDQLNEDYKTIKAEVLAYEKEDFSSTVKAKTFLSSLESGRFKWSEVLSEIQNLVEDQNVEISSYSAAAQNEMSLNVSADEYLDIVSFIKAFSDSERFSNTFLPSISSGYNTQGEEVLTFIFNTQFVSDLEEEAEPLLR